MLAMALSTSASLLIKGWGAKSWRQSLGYDKAYVVPWLALRGAFAAASWWLLYASLHFIEVEGQQAVWYTRPLMSTLEHRQASQAFVALMKRLRSWNNRNLLAKQSRKAY